MCDQFALLARQLDRAFVYVKRQDRGGFEAQVRRLKAMIDEITMPKTEKRTCEYCGHMKVTQRKDLLCTCEGGRRENELVGAASTCEQWKPKETA